MKIITGVITTLIAVTIITSAKAIIDVNIIKVENKNVKELLIETRSDIKIIKEDIKHLLER